MTKDTYEKITSFFKNRSQDVEIIKVINKVLTLSVYLVYPVFVAILIFYHDVRYWKVLFIPGISFVLVSLFRKYVNAPRPYEVLDINPIIKKDTKGQSFPSRHVFSVFIIAMSFCYVSIPIGVALMIIGILLGVIRVVGGVHFPKDVIAGAVVGILFGVVGFYL